SRSDRIRCRCITFLVGGVVKYPEFLHRRTIVVVILDDMPNLFAFFATWSAHGVGVHRQQFSVTRFLNRLEWFRRRIFLLFFLLRFRFLVVRCWGLTR